MFCPQCGTEAEVGARFCMSCGTSLNKRTDSPADQGTGTSAAARPEKGTAKRPVWVWVILLFYLFSIGFTLLSFAIVFSGSIELSPAQQEYFASLGALDYLSSIGVGLLTIWATILLFRLRRSAVPTFTLA